MQIHPPANMSAVKDGKRYSTETATLVAGNDWWDGHNHERNGRQTFLYRTARGAFFFAHITCWDGEADHIEPCEISEAIDFYEQVQPHGTARLPYDQAFPGVTVEDA